MLSMLDVTVRLGCTFTMLNILNVTGRFHVVCCCTLSLLDVTERLVCWVSLTCRPTWVDLF